MDAGTSVEAHGAVRIRVVGVPVDVVPPDELEGIIAGILAEPGQDQFVFLTLRGLLRARRNKEYRRLLQNARLIVPTSPAIVRGAGFLGRTVPARYEPFNFVIRLLGILEKKRATLYLFGLGKRYLVHVEQNIRETFPGLRIVGRYPGYYSRGVERDIITAIKKAAPSVLLVGPGVPKGDRWIQRHKPLFNNGIYLSAPEVMEIFAERRSREAEGGFGRALKRGGATIVHPWWLLRGLSYIWYGILLLVYRLFQLP